MNWKPRISIRSLLLPALMLALVACGGEDPAPSEGGGCTSNVECPGEQVCQENLCVARVVESRELGFRLVPPTSSQYPRQRIPLSPVPLDGLVQIGLSAGVKVAGRVTYSNQPASGPSGVLQFERRTSDGDAQSRQINVQNGEFLAYLLPGTYDVSLLPSDVEMPTWVWKEQTFVLDTSPHWTVTTIDQLLDVEGTISRTDPITGQALKVSGARVFAVSRTTSATSTSSVTDENGFYSIKIAPDSGFYDLYVAPSDPVYSDTEPAFTLIPEVVVEKAFVSEGGSWTSLLEEGSAVISVNIGDYRPLMNPINFQLRADVEEPFDWTGTTVTFETPMGKGTLRVRTPAPPAGAFGMPLVSGFYTVTVRTPPGSPVASTAFELDLSPGEHPLELRPELRTRVSGHVIDAQGDAVSSARIELQPLDGELADGLTATTELGAFEVWLQPGSYSLMAVPLEPSLPRAITTLEIDGEASTSEVTVTLPEPALVSGVVVGTPPDDAQDAEWPRISDVTVQAFEEVNGRRVVLGEGRSNDSGRFRIVIPNRRSE